MGEVARKKRLMIMLVCCLHKLSHGKVTKWPPFYESPSILSHFFCPISETFHLCIPLIPHNLTTQGQYLFIYDALLHALVFGNMEVGVAQLKNHLATLSKPAEDEEEGETRLEREFNVRVWLHVHTCIQYMCLCGPVFMSCIYVHNICAIALHVW